MIHKVSNKTAHNLKHKIKQEKKTIHSFQSPLIHLGMTGNTALENINQPKKTIH